MTNAVQKFLIIYSTIISSIALAVLLMGARSQPTRFDEISVH